MVMSWWETFKDRAVEMNKEIVDGAKHTAQAVEDLVEHPSWENLEKMPGVEIGKEIFGEGADTVDRGSGGTSDPGSGGIPGFTLEESAVIHEVREMMASPELEHLSAAHDTGQSGITVRLGERLVQYEPNLPDYAMSLDMGGEHGFVLGPHAFSSEA